MRRSGEFDYTPAQRLRWVTEELRLLEARFAEAVDGDLIEALIYEQQSLRRQQSACLTAARRQWQEMERREEEAFYGE